MRLTGDGHTQTFNSAFDELLNYGKSVSNQIVVHDFFLITDC